MNAVEIEEAISALALEEFNPAEFTYLFLEAFGNKTATINKLKSGASNKSDIENGVLQRNNIHIAVCNEGEVNQTLDKLKNSPETAKAKAKFILATDGIAFEAEDVNSGETVACDYADFPDHFGFFLSLAGITTVKQIRENSFDIKATSRLNRLYVELLKDNPEWASAERRNDMNHFMARLIFCFFAEDTDIFAGDDLFTNTVEKMSARDSSNTHEVIAEIFRAMNTLNHNGANLPRWADKFPYVNGGLFSGSVDAPNFSRIAKSYLLHVGKLDWQKINPDIFGSMIQAVADDEERGALGMHYTSVPNILKVLNPLFLDDLNTQLKDAGDNQRKLLNLRKRIAKIRVFDPACGSGNFLVIAYKELREIEAEINKKRGEADNRTEIPLTNFRGIELRHFSAEVARLALIIAEYQCDVVYRGQQEALKEFLPLDADNWITCGNALRLDWLSICPPTGTGVKMQGDDLFNTPLDQAQIDFENEGGETYICGNPPYAGATVRPPNGASKETKERFKKETENRKSDLKTLFGNLTKSWKSLDYVAGWFMKAADYGKYTNSASAFVSTNSICQGQQVPILWPLIFEYEHIINFAHTSFKWANLAAKNAGVTVVIVGITNNKKSDLRLFTKNDDDTSTEKKCDFIGAYLVPDISTIVLKRQKPLSAIVHQMEYGSKAADGKNLNFDISTAQEIIRSDRGSDKFIFPYLSADDAISGKLRYCLWVEDKDFNEAMNIPTIKNRIDAVRDFRLKSSKVTTKALAAKPHSFSEKRFVKNKSIFIIPSVSSENREFLPIALLKKNIVITNAAFGLYDAPLWNMALIASQLHLVWIRTVCGQLETRIRYSNTLGWNTFPVPPLTEKNKEDLTRCAEDILLAREAHFPATIADLYNPETMPENLRQAHQRNDETLERIYIGRKFKNDTERLEKLFTLYTKMTTKKVAV